MSNGHESAQSRRALRQARATSAGDQTPSQPASEGTPDSPPTDPPRAAGSATGERRSRRAADLPVDAPPSSTSTSTERISQIRARDREMLRNYRALADQQPERQAEIPTRRQLRLQQQAAREKERPEAAAAGTATAAGTAAAAGLPEQQQNPPSSVSSAVEMTVEQALAAREAIIGQAQNQVAMMEAAAKDDPFAVDLELLAQQKALAERAAILNTRAQKIQQLTQENQQRKPLLNDPTTAHNLSIVSPVEFVREPAENPASPAPSTSSIPVTIGQPPAAGETALGAVAPAVVPQAPSPAERGVRPVVTAPAAPTDPPLVSGAPDSFGRSRVLAQAEAMVREQRRPGSDGVTPIRARSAYGLEPLDAMTAGLARVQRMRIVQYSVVGLGALALITGIMMIISGL